MPAANNQKKNNVLQAIYTFERTGTKSRKKNWAATYCDSINTGLIDGGGAISWPCMPLLHECHRDLLLLVGNRPTNTGHTSPPGRAVAVCSARGEEERTLGATRLADRCAREASRAAARGRLVRRTGRPGHRRHARPRRPPRGSIHAGRVAPPYGPDAPLLSPLVGWGAATGVLEGTAATTVGSVVHTGCAAASWCRVVWPRRCREALSAPSWLRHRREAHLRGDSLAAVAAGSWGHRLRPDASDMV